MFIDTCITEIPINTMSIYPLRLLVVLLWYSFHAISVCVQCLYLYIVFCVFVLITILLSLGLIKRISWQNPFEVMTCIWVGTSLLCTSTYLKTIVITITNIIINHYFHYRHCHYCYCCSYCCDFQYHCRYHYYTHKHIYFLWGGRCISSHKPIRFAFRNHRKIDSFDVQ